MTKPAKLKLTIYQGATFRKRLTWLDSSKAPIDLTGCTARMQVLITLYQLFDDVTNGIKPMPASFNDVEPLLPPLEWPN